MATIRPTAQTSGDEQQDAQVLVYLRGSAVEQTKSLAYRATECG